MESAVNTSQKTFSSSCWPETIIKTLITKSGVVDGTSERLTAGS